LCSYASGLLIEKYRNKSKKSKRINVANIIINLLILGVFKYYNFFATSFTNLFLGGTIDGLLLHVVLPVGISFYTFQALSYSIDVYRGKILPTHDIIQFFAYVSFFPQLVAGPIERATNLLPQFAKPRIFKYEYGAEGLRQILWGLFKKIVVADNCAVYVDQVFATYQIQSGSTLLLAAVFFAFQIYGDFSGYSDIAIGTAKLFGIKLMLNFKVPYFSRDIAEFWRRWHISLTTWFRDYVYIPLGGSRCSKAKIVRNTFVIFLLSGFWHGANWTFIAWGAYHALLFLPLILHGKNRKHRNIVAEGRIFPTFKELEQMILTFFLVVIGWIIFRSNSIMQAWEYVKRMICVDLFSIPWLDTRDFYIPVFIGIIVMMMVEWIHRNAPCAFSFKRTWPCWTSFTVYYLLALSIFWFGGDSESFIYFQF
jgi:D-alanyl-lipoteichoic acid acyltransferase DltB (MBOAT superfamily)